MLIENTEKKNDGPAWDCQILWTEEISHALSEPCWQKEKYPSPLNHCQKENWLLTSDVPDDADPLALKTF